MAITIDGTIVIVMCGLPASGKSTVSEQLSKIYNAKILSSDEIRKEICGDIYDRDRNHEVFKVLGERLKHYASNGINVIVDATNITVKSRRGILDNIKNVDCMTACFVLAKPLRFCIRDNLKRQNKVDTSVIYKMINKFQVPFYEEGFDVIGILNTQLKRKNILSARKIMKQYNLESGKSLWQHGFDTFKKMIKHTKSRSFIYASLLHDYGKIFNNDTEEFYDNHAEFGTYEIMSNYKFMMSLKEELQFLFLINYHELPVLWGNTGNKKLYNIIKDKCEDLYLFYENDEE